MTYKITPGSFNWGAQPSGTSFALPTATPAPVDYGSYLPDNSSNGSYGLNFGNMGADGAGSISFNGAAPRSSALPSAALSSQGLGNSTPTVDAQDKQGWFNRNMENGNIADVAGILQGLGTLWGGFQQNKIARDSLNFQKSAYNTNLANSIKSYNLALTDRMTARGTQNESSSAAVQEQIAANRL